MHPACSAALAATAVDAAGGLLAASVVEAGGRGEMGVVAALLLCVCVGVLTHAVLLPACVWASGPVALGGLAVRLGVAGLGIVLATMASFGVGQVLLAGAAGSSLGGRMLALALAFVVVPAAAAGLVTALAQALDQEPGALRSRVWEHVAGGAAGGGFLLGAVMAIAGAMRPERAWGLYVLSVASLVAAGLPHTLLCVWAAAWRGRDWPPAAMAWRRAGWCCGALCAAATALHGLALA